jgi:hypothetical protein
VRIWIDCHHGAIAKLDIVIGIPAGWPDVPGFEILLGSQVRLRQRRTAEGDTGFPADDDHRPSETLLPERRGRVAARDASANDHDGVSVGSHSHALHSGAQAAERTIRRSQLTSAGKKGDRQRSARYHIREGNDVVRGQCPRPQTARDRTYREPADSCGCEVRLPSRRPRSAGLQPCAPPRPGPARIPDRLTTRNDVRADGRKLPKLDDS